MEGKRIPTSDLLAALIGIARAMKGATKSYDEIEKALIPGIRLYGMAKPGNQEDEELVKEYTSLLLDVIEKIAPGTEIPDIAETNNASEKIQELQTQTIFILLELSYILFGHDDAPIYSDEDLNRFLFKALFYLGENYCDPDELESILKEAQNWCDVAEEALK